jgi:hypothetical protein
MSFGVSSRRGLGVGLKTVTTLSSSKIGGRPALALNFLDTASLDSRITFTRSTTATFVGSDGFIQTAAIDAPRFDYNPATLASKGLLIEEQRTNVLTYSEQFDNAVWVKNNVTVTANTTASPAGTSTADTVTENTAVAAQHGVSPPAIATTAGTSYTMSVYAKNNGRRYLSLATGSANGVVATFDLQTGVISAAAAVLGALWSSPSATITSAGSGWYRCTVTGIDTVGGARTPAYALSNVSTNPASGNGNLYTGDGTSGVYLYGAQIEVGAFATSYIPTVASQVTRTADVAVMTGTNFSSWYNQTEGTFVTKSQLSRQAAITGTTIVMVSASGSVNDQLVVFYRATGNTGFDSVVAGVSQAGLNNGVAITANTIANIAGAYKINDFAMSTNAGTVQTDTSGTLPTVNQMQLGAVWTATLNGCIRSVDYYPTRLPNETLQALTA